MNIQDELKVVLDSLVQLNKKCKNPILTFEEISEQEENLFEFETNDQKIEYITNKLKAVDENNTDLVIKILLELHFLFEEYLWQIDEIHSLVKKMTGNYRDKMEMD
ncbi:hypothetical protein [Paludifilum halophilum]|uniref:Uncharacterized protein n=1 Tax=Paludifilum halophilum TaxID=1642702 RepID=A0A235B1K3_9BACL|nr:hypothetical protein [Paludifilum halophilum]OYD06122.1 hypothetical protein CHM34_17865 [Paludifilum halophilum]